LGGFEVGLVGEVVKESVEVEPSAGGLWFEEIFHGLLRMRNNY
jgi:hypothetical protein